MTDIPKFYLETPDGLIYFVALSGDSTVPGGRKGGHLGNGQYLWSVPVPGTTVPVDGIIYETVVGEYADEWTLTNLDLVSEKLPATTTNAEHAELSESLQEFYRRTYVRSTVEHHLNVSDHKPLRGDGPPPESPRNWVPSAMVALYGPQASHLIPGHLSGFRQHMKTLLENTPGVTSVFTHQNDKTIDVYVRSFWDPPRTKTEGKGRMARTTQTWSSNNFLIPCIDLIGGNTLADAIVQWEARESEIIALIQSYSTTTTCGHCNGLGFTTPKKA